MCNDFEGSGRLVVELNIAEIRTLQLDVGIEYLVQNGRQVGRRGQPRAQLIQPGHGRKLVAHARTHLAVTGER
jgi:hypothetical protein